MLEDEIREKQKTILEIFSRLNMHEEAIAQRVKSGEYQSLMKKAFRNWSGTESAKKQEYIRNILCNAAGASIVNDDVISLFIEWLQTYSEFHFAVIGEIYRNPGSTRLEIWDNLGKGEVREDSAEADLLSFSFATCRPAESFASAAIRIIRVISTRNNELVRPDEAPRRA